MIVQELLIGIALLVGAFVTLRNGYVAGRELSRLRDTPTSLVGSLVEGPAEVTGRAVPLQRTRAKWSGKDAAIVKYAIEERRQSGRSGTWVTVQHWTEPDPMRFLVDDGTGKALVQAEVADFDAPTTYVAESKLGRDPPQAVLDTLHERGVKFEGLFGANKHMRFTETSLDDGAQVLVEGYALLADAAKGVGARMAITRGPDNELFVTTSSESDETKTLVRRRLGQLTLGALLALIGAVLTLSGAIAPLR